MAGPCLGADHTKEFLSFEKQPSLFKGRNQSWFHPLRTPSRPGAAAPGPQWRAAGSRWFSSHTIDRPRCTDRQLLGFAILLASYDVLRTTQGCALVVTPESRRPTPYCHPDGATVGSDWRDLQPGIAAVLEGRALPWRRPHEGISILWETTFAFQRAKPIVVSPFENPFPTRGRGPWTPWGAAGSRWFLRMPSTGRDAPTASCSVLGFCWHRVAFWGQGGVLFSLVAGIPGWRSLQSPLRGSVGMTVIWNRRDSGGSGRMAGTRKTPRPRGLALSVIPSEQSEPRDLHAGIAAALVERALPCSQKVIR